MDAVVFVIANTTRRRMRDLISLISVWGMESRVIARAGACAAAECEERLPRVFADGAGEGHDESRKGVVELWVELVFRFPAREEISSNGRVRIIHAAL